MNLGWLFCLGIASCWRLFEVCSFVIVLSRWLWSWARCYRYWSRFSWPWNICQVLILTHWNSFILPICEQRLSPLRWYNLSHIFIPFIRAILSHFAIFIPIILLRRYLALWILIIFFPYFLNLFLSIRFSLISLWHQFLCVLRHENLITSVDQNIFLFYLWIWVFHLSQICEFCDRGFVIRYFRWFVI